MNKQQKKEKKNQKRKKITQAKKAISEKKKIQTRKRIKQIKATLRERMNNAVVLTPEQKAEYLAHAKKVLNLPEDSDVTFEHVVEAMKLAKQRFDEQGIEIPKSDDVAVE